MVACFQLAIACRTGNENCREQGTLKINTYGAFLHDACTGATGTVVRGSDGRLCAASAHWINYVGLSLLAEAEALRDDIRLVRKGELENTS